MTRTVSVIETVSAPMPSGCAESPGPGARAGATARSPGNPRPLSVPHGSKIGNLRGRGSSLTSKRWVLEKVGGVGGVGSDASIWTCWGRGRKRARGRRQKDQRRLIVRITERRGTERSRDELEDRKGNECNVGKEMQTGEKGRDFNLTD
eukprot:767231-Hanusia_phi.AAC.5